MVSKEEFVIIHTLHKQGFSIRQMAKILNLNRRTVTKRLREEDLKPYKERTYSSKIDEFKDYIGKRITVKVHLNSPLLARLNSPVEFVCFFTKHTQKI